jgi:hypothetical protein
MPPKRETPIAMDILKLLDRVPDQFSFKVHGSRMQRSGVPDIYFTCREISGRSVWFEVKRPDGPGPTKLQSYTMGLLQRAGAESVVVRSVAEVQRWLVEHGCSIRPKP